MGLGFGVQVRVGDLGFRFRVGDLEFRFRVGDLRLRVLNLGLGVIGGFRMAVLTTREEGGGG